MSSGGDTPIEIEVRLTGPLRSLAGQGAVVLSLPAGTTLREALLALDQALAPPFMEQVVVPLADGRSALPILLLNRARLQGTQALDQPVSHGDVVAFVTPMDGG